ncbi:hypothetical protein AVEN_68915-1 [Araneus ventricosus]|uniref:Uncharacterized protein n=1 Tax=Araneus ventricosus TaxID=182803 RepID=A0A4Y2DWQ4_ARAVE|nr:hypothetical protein AVEN_68915-1 [Araneus ventricosus]
MARKLETNEDPPCLWVWCTLNQTWVKRPPTGVVRKFGKRVPAQVSSSGLGPKVRSQSQNRLCVASKSNVNVTKLD